MMQQSKEKQESPINDNGYLVEIDFLRIPKE